MNIMFYITSKLSLRGRYRKGSRFKEGDVLAIDESFFQESGNDIVYKTGILVRAAVTPTDQTYEDSIMISRDLVDRSASYITMQTEVVLGAKSNVSKMVAPGDTIEVNDPLVVFENLATKDEEHSDLLGRIGSQYDEVIQDLSRNVVRSKKTGKVVDVKIYYNYPLEDLSSSLQNLIRKMRKRVSMRKEALEGAPTDEPIHTSEPEYVKGNRIMGKIVDGVMLVFLVQSLNHAGPGDKYTSGACKGIVSRVFEKGEEPLVETDGTTVDFVFSPLSTISRMTNDIFMSLWTHAVLVGLQEKVIEIAEE